MPPQPTDPAHRQRRNRVSTAGVIDAAPARGRTVPTLGSRRPDSTAAKPIAWHPETRRWWRTIWLSGVSERFVDAHVPGLRRLARLIDLYWTATEPADVKTLHAEIRMSEKEFGLTPMAARSMGWEFRRPTPVAEKPERLPPGADPRKILSMSTRRTAG